MDAKSPTKSDILAARTRAGLTQAEAAALAGYGSQTRWAEFENGKRQINAIAWLYFLHVAGLERLPFRSK